MHFPEQQENNTYLVVHKGQEKINNLPNHYTT